MGLVAAVLITVLIAMLKESTTPATAANTSGMVDQPDSRGAGEPRPLQPENYQRGPRTRNWNESGRA